MSLKLEDDGECGEGREPETGNGGMADDRSLMTILLKPGWIAVDPDYDIEMRRLTFSVRITKIKKPKQHDAYEAILECELA